MNVITARDAREWEAWLEAHHHSESEIWIKIAKKASGVASVQPAEATEVALCFGWIDSHRRRGDQTTYFQRYSPRRRGSRWSQLNVAAAERLIESGRMRPAGFAEFRKRASPDETG
ncbi:YdeI/OmpD-associated family protein [Microlunatus parietis]|uniref:Uncharacterized protein YdeI (YjbR/CyaY-like superfamily) n=1 Tax=Microlunatus parietis TaxID=682979 RepID=A0A7Y9IBJ0_9ACTN|nr:hypothetical protein [Microlunatus parietis]NYE73824.1 uncharacterized protein YdeI (YjbR/CyaY-like superfamily) [Microlunatus parietis]